jgi:6-pyruvoyltetrahydropterin/6-carboxytetrahydropterin synthase
MYIIAVEKSFDAAHYLRGYGGKCEKLHGHRFKVVVRLNCRELNEVGLAYDFTELKRQVMEITGKYDHQCLNDIGPFDRVNPSSENIASAIYNSLAPEFTGDIVLDSVEVWESPESSALYRPG